MRMGDQNMRGAGSTRFSLVAVLLAPVLSGIAVLLVAAMPFALIGMLTWVTSTSDLAARVALVLPIAALVLSLAAFAIGRRSAALSWVTKGAVVLSALATFSAALLVPRVQHGYRTFACTANVENIAQALQMYLTEHDHFPPAGGWCDALEEYVRNVKVFQCPERFDLNSGYAFNAALDRLPSSGVPQPLRTIAVFESDAGWNASGGRELLVKKPRHGGGDVYGYAAGQMNDPARPLMQWLPRDAVVSGRAGLIWNPREVGK